MQQGKVELVFPLRALDDVGRVGLVLSCRRNKERNKSRSGDGGGGERTEYTTITHKCQHGVPIHPSTGKTCQRKQTYLRTKACVVVLPRHQVESDGHDASADQQTAGDGVADDPHGTLGHQNALVRVVGRRIVFSRVGPTASRRDTADAAAPAAGAVLTSCHVFTDGLFFVVLVRTIGDLRHGGGVGVFVFPKYRRRCLFGAEVAFFYETSKTLATTRRNHRSKERIPFVLSSNTVLPRAFHGIRSLLGRTIKSRRISIGTVEEADWVLLGYFKTLLTCVGTNDGDHASPKGVSVGTVF